MDINSCLQGEFEWDLMQICILNNFARYVELS